MLLRNKSGILIDVPEEETETLLAKGYTKATPQEELANKTVHNGIPIQYASPDAHHDGYGESQAQLKYYLAEQGIHLETTYKGQSVGLAYGYPHNLNDLETPIKLLYTMFESTKIPENWHKDLKKADKILVPSTYVQTTLAQYGYEATVVPLAYNQNIFTYKPKKKREKYVILHYDAFNLRKGFDILFKAFTEEFTKDEPVELVLKTTRQTTPIPILKSQYPNIRVIKEQVPQTKLAELLHEADLAVFPSRGEGFGIPPLEALATGTPTIIPNAHGFAHYFSPKHFIELQVKENVPALYENLKGQDVGTMVEPDATHLRHLLRKVYTNQERELTKAKKASDWVKENYTYTKTAKQLAEILKSYLHKPKKGKVAHTIIVLTHNALAYTKKALQSIQEHSEIPYQLIVVDNASTDGTQAYLKTQNIDNLLLNKENRGVAGGRNQALKLAKAEYITILDNDTQVKKGWQHQIIEALQQPKTGIVGTKGTNIAYLKPVLYQPTDEEDVDVVPGFAFSLKRELLATIGYLTEQLPNKNYWHEDLEYCLRAKKAGYRVKNLKLAIDHEPHQSIGQHVTDEQTVEKVPGYYENAAAIPALHTDENTLYIHRDYRGDDKADSYDRITDGIVRELRNLGVTVLRKPSLYTPPPSFNLCKAIDLTHKDKRLIVLHQENDRSPEEWRQAIQHVDYILAGSPHVVAISQNEPYKDKIIDYTISGVDEAVYNTKVKPLKDFYPNKKKLLMVSATQPRKNTLNLLRWYTELFTQKDPVVLIIKDIGYGQRHITEPYINELRKNKNAPEIAYIYEDWTHEHLARVYRTVALDGAYIHPHRAECYGLSPLEAAATGARVGTTDYGGTHYNLDGIPNVTLFSYELQPSTFHNHPGEPYYKPHETPNWAEPNEAEVKKYLIDTLKTKYDPELAEKQSKAILKRHGYKVKAKQLLEVLYAHT